MVRQFCDDTGERSGVKGTRTGEQEIRERGKLLGEELDNQALQECRNEAV
jgi:hypothetical protein